MKRNEVKGVQPFNAIQFKSCYFHQLLAGLSCFNMDKDELLLSFISYIREDFEIENKAFLEDKEFQKKIGFQNRKCNINKNRLIKCINKGQPIIVGVDCYYLESRAETYMTRHAPHFILVYGYDLEKGEAKVVDHDYINSPEYVKNNISLENLLFANKMLKRRGDKKFLFCRVLKKRKRERNFTIWDYIDVNRFLENKNHSHKNLDELKRLFTADLAELKKKTGTIIQYLAELKIFYFTFSKIRLIADIPERIVSIESLMSAYSHLLSLFWKMRAQDNYEYGQKRIENITRKMDEIIALEEEFYSRILEVKG